MTERWEYGDPARVLERRGQCCTGCYHLEPWRVAGVNVVTCVNRAAPEKMRRGAPEKRCGEWAHVQKGNQ